MPEVVRNIKTAVVKTSNIKGYNPQTKPYDYDQKRAIDLISPSIKTQKDGQLRIV